jgi:hypothetical protein
MKTDWKRISMEVTAAVESDEYKQKLYVNEMLSQVSYSLKVLDKRKP